MADDVPLANDCVTFRLNLTSSLSFCSQHCRNPLLSSDGTTIQIQESAVCLFNNGDEMQSLTRLKAQKHTIF